MKSTEASKRNKMNRQRGKNLEYALVYAWQNKGGEAYRIPSSGSAKGFKGDVTCNISNHRFLASCKKTAMNSFGLKKEFVDEITEQAEFKGVKPLLVFQFLRNPMWVALPLEDFFEILTSILK
jgi:Holliday junction resolvase